MKKKPIILVTNDDGIRAEGIKALAAGIAHLGKVIIVAPENEQSATSHAITLDRPLRIKKYSDDRYGVSGTPADCLLMAVQGILGEKPDIVVSGINHGPNLGEDVMYSGTVAAAIEGYLMGISSIAFSITSWDPVSFDAASLISSRLTSKMLEGMNENVLLWNVNIPAIPMNEIGGLRVARLGSRVYNDAVIKQTDPRGKECYWIGGGEPGWKKEKDSDFCAITEGYVSLTPLMVDMTDRKRMSDLDKWDLDLSPK
ncbi:MAG: 5'/3'-nucleotidase SurE [Bacteroidales bacterium]|nr:5'/3'-nucleotidase SurE [Candidatus Latescibacterota bacterium]